MTELGRLARATGFLLRRVNGVFAQRWMAYFAEAKLGITPVQGAMLVLIDENPGITQIELARLMKIEGSTLWQLAKRLTDLGYVQRYRQPDDKRAYALHLSKPGRQVLATLDAGSMIHQESILSVLSHDEREQLRDMLLRLIARGEALDQSVPNTG